MSRRFRLAAVYRLRTVRLEQTARTLAVARQAERNAQTEIENLFAELHACSAARSATGEEIRFAAVRREGLRERIARSQEALEQLKRESLDAVAVWETARAELHAIEVLRDRFRRAELMARLREEQRQTDELAAVRYLANLPAAGQHPTPGQEADR